MEAAAEDARPTAGWLGQQALDATAVILLRDPRDSVATLKLRTGMPEHDVLLAMASALDRLVAEADSPGVVLLRLEDLHRVAGRGTDLPSPDGPAARVGKPFWRGVLSDEEAATCEAVFRSFLNRFYGSCLSALRVFEGDAARDRLSTRPPYASRGSGLPWLRGWHFGEGRDGQSCLRQGWWGAEDGYVWSNETARLVLPRPSPDRCVLRLAGEIYLGPDASRALEVVVDGLSLGHIELRGVSVVECDVPGATRGSMDIELRLPEASRPRDDTPGHTDDRRLGFRLGVVELYGTGPVQAPAPAMDLPALDALDDNALMRRFESLGENCEFGLVQRRCGAEPLGLLRFSSTPLHRLVAALDQGFDGLGAPGQLEAVLSGTGREYMVQDRAFGFLYHAWVKAGEMTPVEIVARETRRVPFLARKLLEDLAGGEKIFVFHGREPLVRDQAGRLLDAMRRHGPATLLWVEQADATHMPGTVRVVEPGLLQGFMDRFAPGDDAHDLSLACWVQVCREAYRLQTLGRVG